MAHNVPRTFNGDRQWYRVGVDIAIDVLDASPHELVVTKPPGLASELPRDPAAPSVLTRLRDQGVDAVNVIGGMLASTFLAIFFVPLFFVVVLGLFRVRPTVRN